MSLELREMQKKQSPSHFSPPPRLMASRRTFLRSQAPSAPLYSDRRLHRLDLLQIANRKSTIANPMNDRSQLHTELRLPESTNLDAMTPAQAVAVMNQQDRKALEAVEIVRDAVVRAVDLVVRAFEHGG